MIKDRVSFSNMFFRWRFVISFTLMSISLLYVTFSYRYIAPSVTSTAKKKLILGWTTFFGNSMSNYLTTFCPELPCEYTRNRDKLSEADAIVFHQSWDTKRDDLPPSRLSHQRFVIFTQESAASTPAEPFGSLQNYFNWTMNMRRDSDIPWPLMFVERDYSMPPIGYSKETLLKKTKPIAWFVSNCDTQSKRESYVSELRRHIRVDIFGKCGTENFNCATNSKTCSDLLTSDYFYYLALENSVCKDYITEKFWSRLSDDLIVPIVLKRSLVAPFAPAPDSFLAIDDFKSPKALAAHLNETINNMKLYESYFAWRLEPYQFRHNSPKTKHYTGFCRLCEALWDQKLPSKSYENVQNWWTSGSQCDAGFAKKFLQES